MSFLFPIQNGKVVKVDLSTNQPVAEWSPMGTRVVEAVMARDMIVVREDPDGFPPEQSNVYALDGNLKLLWTAQLPEPSDPYVALRLDDGTVIVRSRLGYRCELGNATGAIVAKEPPQNAGQSFTAEFMASLAPWKAFFSLAGGSILYCASALLILYGIVKIMTPILAADNGLKDCLPSLGTLNLYELALLGVLLAIVICRNVTDDALSLVILITLFLIGNGIFLDVVATRGPSVVLYIGIACTAVAFVKLGVLKRFVLTRLDTGALVAGGILLAWNFICGPYLTMQKMKLPRTEAFRREPWLAAWLIVLGAAVLALVETTRKSSGKDVEPDPEPLLRTPLMGELFILLVLAAVGIHQYAMAYLLSLSYSFGDFIPLICLGSLLSVELLRRTRRSFEEAQAVVACLPLAITVLAILARAVTARAGWWPELLWYPPVMLGLTGAGLLALSLLHRRPWLWYVAGAYAAGVTLTAGFNPDRPYAVNWQVSGAVIVIMFLGLGIVYRNAKLCLAGVLITAIGLGTTKVFQGWAAALDVEVVFAVMGLAGLATLLVYLIFPGQLDKAIAFFAALAVTVFLFNFASTPIAWPDLPVAIGVLGLGAAVRVRAKDLAPLIVLALPIGWRAAVFAKNMSAWGYIVLSFLLLAAGAAVSFRKGGKKAANAGNEPAAGS